LSDAAGSLQAWLDRLEAAHPRRIDLGLERVRAVLEALAPPLAGVPAITVAGTNGKGSTVAMLEAIYRAAGYRTGTYTSPHLLAYNERIAIAGVPVPDEAIVAAFERIERARGAVSLSYFEFGTLAALECFARARCEVLLLEVGLGGRLDAVNALDADLAIIASVDLDHQEFLGTTREAIGREKAGILRPGRPALCNDPDPPASVPAHARALGAPLECIGADYRIARAGGGLAYEDVRGALTLPVPALPGAVQVRNAAAAVRAVRRLGDRLPVPTPCLGEGLRRAALPGRFERRGHGPEWVFDVGHNPEAGRNLARNLADHPAAGPTHAVLGMLADKDAAGFAAPLAGLVQSFALAPLGGARGRSAAELAAALPAETPLRCHASVREACLAARAGAARVVVCGSFHTVEEALRAWPELSLAGTPPVPAGKTVGAGL
jgi:dihydrofolate synthase / folylpolyglutamate synthase